jgi:hypothetical protein
LPVRAGGRTVRFVRRGAILTAFAVVTVLAVVSPVGAWRPYAHVFIGANAYNDAVADGGHIGGGVSSGINVVVGARLRAYVIDALARRV